MAPGCTCETEKETNFSLINSCLQVGKVQANEPVSDISLMILSRQEPLLPVAGKQKMNDVLVNVQIQNIKGNADVDIGTILSMPEG